MFSLCLIVATCFNSNKHPNKQRFLTDASSQKHNITSYCIRRWISITPWIVWRMSPVVQRHPLGLLPIMRPSLSGFHVTAGLHRRWPPCRTIRSLGKHRRTGWVQAYRNPAFRWKCHSTIPFKHPSDRRLNPPLRPFGDRVGLPRHMYSAACCCQLWSTPSILRDQFAKDIQGTDPALDRWSVKYSVTNVTEKSDHPSHSPTLCTCCKPLSTCVRDALYMGSGVVMDLTLIKFLMKFILSYTHICISTNN